MAFQDKEEFFDGLWDHLFEGDTPDDDDQKWFDEKVIPFFDKLFESNSGDGNDGGNSGSSRKRRSASSGTGVSGPRRKRRAAQSGGGNYGSNIFFGGGN